MNGRGEVKGTKGLKKAFRKITKFGRIIALMAAAGLFAAALSLLKSACFEYAAARADIVLTYPEIAKSENPDGSRFTYYDLISGENIAAAIEIMRKKGKYENFAAADLRGCFDIQSCLEDSAGESVAAERSEGNDFSYVANDEYRLTFVQPCGIGKDYSRDFLHALIEVSREKIAGELGGINGFKELTRVDGVENCDYSEKLRVYRTKIRAVISCLDYLHEREPNFAAPGGATLKDIEGKYSFLVTNRLDGISDFIETSGISKDVKTASNKLKVNIETNALRLNKHSDRSAINSFAMTNYDQTFTENLINVIQNEKYGLYQARPKTAFDTAVMQKHTEDENIAEYSAKISKYNKELEAFANVARSPEERERLKARCEELIADFETEYESVSCLARGVVEEYYNEVNRGFITAEIERRRFSTIALFIKTGAAFALGAVFAFAAAIFIGKKMKRAEG